MFKRERMKQNVVDVLMYLFENLITEENPTAIPEHEHMFDRLQGLGFPHHDILLAFDWLEDLADIHTDLLSSTESKPALNTQSVRIYSELEKLLLEPDCINFLIHLEHNQIITALSREVILDRVIALDVELELEQLKWVIMIVLYSQPGEENAYAWIENLIFETNEGVYLN
jgi:Smg protein